MSPPETTEETPTDLATISNYVSKVAEGLDDHISQMRDRPDLAQAMQSVAITYALSVLGLAGVRTIILTATGVVPPADALGGDIAFVLQRHSNLPQDTADDQETSKQLELSFAESLQKRHASKETATAS